MKLFEIIKSLQIRDLVISDVFCKQGSLPLHYILNRFFTQLKKFQESSDTRLSKVTFCQVNSTVSREIVRYLEQKLIPTSASRTSLRIGTFDDLDISHVPVYNNSRVPTLNTNDATLRIDKPWTIIKKP